MPARKTVTPARKVGRPAGSRNKENKLKDKALARILAGHKAPLEFLLTLMHNDKAPLDKRIDAAKAALPYVHRKMPIAIENSERGPFRVLDVNKLGGMTEAELLVMRELLSKALPDGDAVE